MRFVHAWSAIRRAFCLVVASLACNHSHWPTFRIVSVGMHGCPATWSTLGWYVCRLRMLRPRIRSFNPLPCLPLLGFMRLGMCECCLLRMEWLCPFCVHNDIHNDQDLACLQEGGGDDIPGENAAARPSKLCWPWWPRLKFYLDHLYGDGASCKIYSRSLWIQFWLWRCMPCAVWWSRASPLLTQSSSSFSSCSLTCLSSVLYWASRNVVKIAFCLAIIEAHTLSYSSRTLLGSSMTSLCSVVPSVKRFLSATLVDRSPFSDFVLSTVVTCETIDGARGGIWDSIWVMLKLPPTACGTCSNSG